VLVSAGPRSNTRAVWHPDKFVVPNVRAIPCGHLFPADFTMRQTVILGRGFRHLVMLIARPFAIEYRDAEGERLSPLAAELVRLNSDVIFSFGGEQAPIVKQATASIPIVVVVSNDPVASGPVASLARPGGNITGLTYVHDQLAGKAVELLKRPRPGALVSVFLPCLPTKAPHPLN
jgi:hypothetical protein